MYLSVCRHGRERGREGGDSSTPVSSVTVEVVITVGHITTGLMNGMDAGLFAGYQ
jgi:hypothetical protein